MASHCLHLNGGKNDNWIRGNMERRHDQKCRAISPVLRTYLLSATAYILSPYYLDARYVMVEKSNAEWKNVIGCSFEIISNIKYSPTSIKLAFLNPEYIIWCICFEYQKMYNRLELEYFSTHTRIRTHIRQECQNPLFGLFCHSVYCDASMQQLCYSIENINSMYLLGLGTHLLDDGIG